MKQLSALGARRQFFRNPRARMRGLRPGDELGDNPELMGQPGFNYFGGEDPDMQHASFDELFNSISISAYYGHNIYLQLQPSNM